MEPDKDFLCRSNESNLSLDDGMNQPITARSFFRGFSAATARASAEWQSVSWKKRAVLQEE